MIRIITDSTSDISQNQAKELGIDIIPLRVNFAHGAYRDGVDITNAEFYKKLTKSEELPTTSQINPYEFYDFFKKYINDGDEVVGIFISSHLSGTYQSAVAAKEMLKNDDNIYIIDSLNVTFPLGLLIKQAVRIRDKGLTAERIAEEIESLKSRVRLVAVVSTLKYLYGGRISSGTAVVGSMLGINPIIAIIDGKVESVGKTRGRKQAFRWMLDYIEKEGIDYNYPIAFGSSNSAEILNECMEFFKPYIKTEDELIQI
jgi:DegV family protein with EDD domain